MSKLLELKSGNFKTSKKIKDSYNANKAEYLSQNIFFSNEDKNFTLKGDNSYLEYTSKLTEKFNSEMTIECLLQYTVFDKIYCYRENNFRIEIGIDKVEVQYETPEGIAIYSKTIVNLKDSIWLFYQITFNANTNELKVYINGEDVDDNINTESTDNGISYDYFTNIDSNIVIGTNTSIEANTVTKMYVDYFALYNNVLPQSVRNNNVNNIKEYYNYKYSNEEALTSDLFFQENLLFRSNETGFYEIYKADFDGSNRVQITNDDYDKFHLDIHPDGERIIYASDKGSGQQVYEYNVLTQQETQITSGGSEKIFCTYSPTGKYIAYVDRIAAPPGGISDIYVWDRNTSIHTKLDTGLSSQEGLNPSWLPDESKIFWVERWSGTGTSINGFETTIPGFVRTKLTNFQAYVLGGFEAIDNIISDVKNAAVYYYYNKNGIPKEIFKNTFQSINFGGDTLLTTTSSSSEIALQPTPTYSGDKFVYILKDVNREVYIANSDGSNPVLLTTFSGSSPNVNFGGGATAATGKRQKTLNKSGTTVLLEENGQIYTCSLSTGATVNISQNPYDEKEAIFGIFKF